MSPPRDPSPPPPRRRFAAFAGLFLPLAAFAAVWALTDPLPPPRVPAGRERRAAIAIRDDVTPFQKWGSRAFTFGQLERFYAEAAYFTEGGGDCLGAFRDRLKSLLARHDAVDVFLLAHGNDYHRSFVGLEPAELRKLRLVYNTGCGDAAQGREWLDLGVRTYIGHHGWSESPIFYFYFLRRWLRGVAAAEALAGANEAMHRVLLRLEDSAESAELAFASSRALLAGDGAASIAGFAP